MTGIFRALYVCKSIILTNVTKIEHSQMKDSLQYLRRMCSEQKRNELFKAGRFQFLINQVIEFKLNWLFNVTINDIPVIYVTAHRCAGGLKKKLDLWSGSQRHRHFVGFFNVPVLAPTRDQPFYTVIPTHRPI